MRRISFVISFLALSVFAVVAQGANAVSLAQQADSAYRAERYYDAIALYDSLMSVQGRSAGACYNMGNCCYRVNRRGEALLWYERALRLDPTDKDARANIAFVRNKLPDVAVADSNDVLSVGRDRFVNHFTSDAWAAVCLIAFIATILLVACYIFASAPWLRKTGFFAGIAMLIVAVVAMFCAVAQARARTSRDAAIVVAPSVTISANPRADAPAAFSLAEGSKVHVLDSLRDGKADDSATWLLITPDGDKQGWVSADSVKVI